MRHIYVTGTPEPFPLSVFVSRVVGGLDFYLILAYVFPEGVTVRGVGPYHPRHRRIWERINGREDFGKA